MIMDYSTIYMMIGFSLAAYAVVANDSVQTLGTFLSSNSHYKWYWLWLAASSVLVGVLSYGWYVNGGDLSYGRLSHIPMPAKIAWYHAMAPALLLFLTRYGLPVSTTFLILSVFASTVVLEQMLLKSVYGYVLASLAAFAIWWVISKFVDEHISMTNEKHKKYWRIAQWFATGFLWAQWLSHDVANIAVYLPRNMDFGWLMFALVTLVSGLGWIFYSKGGRIQGIVLNKSGTRYVRSATIIDIVYALILLFFKEYNSIPMSTTWVFVGLLTGRELAIYHLHDPNKHLKVIFPMLIKDFFKVIVGLAASVALVFVISWYESLL